MGDCCISCIIPFAIAFIYLIYKFTYGKPKMRDIAGKHILITGGSSGIGKASAIEAAKMGAHVTIIGRDEAKLEKALVELKHSTKNAEQKIQYVSLDLAKDFDTIQSAINTIEEKVGPIYMLINSAGYAVCGTLENTSAQDIASLMNINYFGSIYATKAVLRGMKERDEGSVVFVSSVGGLLGIFGYSGYCPSKFAVRGLGEALMMETVGTGVSVTISYPPDTDTPGFEAENATKPLETKLISESGGLISAETVARQLLKDALVGSPYSVVGLEGWMMVMLTGQALQGISHLLFQSCLMGPLRIVMACYMISFHRIILKCKNDKKNQ